MTSRRILITGLSTYWGGALAQAIERDPEVETVIGVDRSPPKVALERTEFVRVVDQHSLIRRIVHAAEIDTVVDTRLVVDSIVTTPKRAHENNVIGTMNVLAAAGGPDSPVRKLVFKSSAHYYGSEQDDPAFFTEEMRRPHPPRTLIERDIVEAERQVADFKVRNPDTLVTCLRFANGLGPRVRSSHGAYLGLPVVPTILGFDPRYQFIHHDDMAGALEHSVRHDLDGVYNCGADGVLALSEVISLLGRTNAPVLPPVGTGLAAAALRRAGISIPPEMLQLLRFGRAIDNRKLKATGFRYRYTTRETIIKLGEHQRIAPLVDESSDGYRYEEELEKFLRRSPSVRATATAPPGPTNVAPRGERRGGGGEEPAERVSVPPRAATEDYDALDADEVVALLPSLPEEDLVALREHEAAHAARPEVLQAIDRIARRHRV